jgi:hypothetical protein
MKSYAYMIFWPFYYPENILSWHQNDVPLGHLFSECFRSSTLNFQVLFAWAIPTPVIPYCYYYSFNPYKHYVCECESVYMWVCDCEYVCVYVCVRVWVCMCAKIQKISKNLKSKKKQKNRKQLKIPNILKNPRKL